MGILKGILHHWNKTSSAYDTIHPETEVAQVTDWNTGIVNTLASTGLSSLVNVLSSDSLLALLIKKVFDATGVKYSMEQNGYVCFGSLVGGLIIQWGKNTLTSNGQQFTFPLTSSTGCFVMFASDRDYGCDRLGIVPNSRNTFVCWNKGDSGQFTQSDFSWIALCI
jgi:hypothetical protein